MKKSPRPDFVKSPSSHPQRASSGPEATSSEAGKGLTDRIDALFAQWDKPDSPGCALGVIQDGRLVYTRGYGMANLEHGIPISSKTVFRIGSTAKQFTAMSIALLAEQGKISLDDDIRLYLPEMPNYERPVPLRDAGAVHSASLWDAGAVHSASLRDANAVHSASLRDANAVHSASLRDANAVTIRHLVHHTSGLRDYLTLMSLAGMREDDFYTDDQVVEMVARQKGLNFAPGDEYLYSNTGYYLLGVIVKRVSGVSLREFAEENIFKPLGMNHTHFHDDHNEIVQHRAAGYAPLEEGGYRINMTTLDMVGDGGVFTTVEDLLLWDRNFYDNKLGKGGQSLIQQILTPGTLASGEKLEYAFGLMVSEYRGLEMVSHGGAFVGFRAEMIRFPEQALSVVCLANLSTFAPSRLARQVADIYLADELAAESVAQVEFIELSQEELQDKAGVYQSATTGLDVELYVREGALLAETSGYTFPLEPVGATGFRAVNAPVDVEIQFERQRQDDPWQMHVTIAGQKPDILQAIQVVSPSVGQLAEYAGEFFSEELQATYKLVLDAEQAKLYARHRGAPQEPLKPGLCDVFRFSFFSLHFIRDDKGSISGFNADAGRVRNVYFHKLQ